MQASVTTLDSDAPRPRRLAGVDVIAPVPCRSGHRNPSDRIAGAIAYPRTTWEALNLLAELARRDGRSEDAARIEAQRRTVLDAAAASIADPDLRAALARSASRSA